MYIHQTLLSEWIAKQSRELVERKITKKPQAVKLCAKGKIHMTEALPSRRPSYWICICICIHLISLFACWFQPGLISQPTMFSSHNKPASAGLISPETNQRTGLLTFHNLAIIKYNVVVANLKYFKLGCIVKHPAN